MLHQPPWSMTETPRRAAALRPLLPHHPPPRMPTRDRAGRTIRTCDTSPEHHQCITCAASPRHQRAPGASPAHHRRDTSAPPAHQRDPRSRGRCATDRPQPQRNAPQCTTRRRAPLRTTTAGDHSATAADHHRDDHTAQTDLTTLASMSAGVVVRYTNFLSTQSHHICFRWPHPNIATHD